MPDKKPWWGPDNRLHIPVDAVVEPNFASVTSAVRNSEAQRRNNSRKEESMNVGSAIVLTVLAVLVIWLTILHWPLPSPNYEGWQRTSDEKEKECAWRSTFVKNNEDGVPVYAIVPECD
ncbi:hypothetical protein HYW60_02860 [Candidatus Kaiserbacteria bacterium]|nr:hypothetical protein [Candidatus Kaiserbacteria bacterium]